MRYLLKILFISLLLIPVLSKGQQEEDLILQSKISVHFNDQPISTILDSISNQIGYYFSYDPELVKPQQKISISFSEVSIEKILNAIFKEKLAYKVLKNQIIIYEKEETIQKQILQKEKEKPVIILSGKVISLEDNSPIPYASISIWKKSIGTMSNIDGDFDLKIPVENKNDTLIFSCLGYQKYLLPIPDFEYEKNNIFLRPASVRIKEIKVKAISAMEIIQEMLDKIPTNYPNEAYLMTSFYRETMQQDENYINVSEAIMEILKNPYNNSIRTDRTRFIKGRKNKQESPFKWVDFKMQGGPYYITLLDVVKNNESFIDQKSLAFYKYDLDEIIFYRDRPTYVITFKPIQKSKLFPYEGKLYIDRETLGIVQVDFSLTNYGIKESKDSMIKKKPKGFNVRPESVSYRVTYKEDGGLWFFNTAHADIQFKVKSRDDKINSTYTSISDLLITDYEKTDLKRFKSSETFHSSEIFSDIIDNYDEEFWGNYNTIKPNENLIKAIKPKKK